MKGRPFWILLLSLLVPLAVVPSARAETAQEPIRIGEINSYKAVPLYTENYRKGWTLAVEEVNAQGGIKGRKVVVVDRDDQGKPAEAVRLAEELMLREKVDFLSGCIFGNVCAALSGFADKNKIVLMRWFSLQESEFKRENNYVFGLNSLFVTARAPVRYALAEHPELTRWSSVAPNYVYGHQGTEIFRDHLKKLKPDSVWNNPYWYSFGKLNVGATIGAIERENSQAVLNLSVASDLTQLIRQGHKRGFDRNKVIVSLESGIPEYLDSIGAELPEGWIMTGYPGAGIDTPEHKAFAQAYEARWGKPPGWMSLNGYNAYQFILGALEKAPSLKTEDLVKAMEGLTVRTPIGPLTMRAADHVSTKGSWVGRSHVEKGAPQLVKWKYYAGDLFLPDEKDVVR